MNETSKLSRKTIAIICCIVLILLGIPFSIRHKQANMIEKIYNAYSDNANRAMKKYDGKNITLIGEVSSISSSAAEMYIVPIGGEYSLRFVDCNVSDEKNQKRVSKLKKGKKVKVKGTVHLIEAAGIPGITIDVDRIS